ncbi:hypothetical protein D3C72_1339230 [compost metagenome]
MCSRRARWRCIHSTWSANTLGVLHSTVVGRFSTIGRAADGSHTAETASETSSEKSSSARLKVSGEYS